MRICMHSTKDIIEEASSLPVEERIIGWILFSKPGCFYPGE